MRILLDECVNADLKPLLAGHEVFTVQEVGWSGTRNGELLKLIAGKFDIFITTDQSLPHQQNLSRVTFPVLLLVPTGPTFEFLLRLVPDALAQLGLAPPGKVTVIKEPGEH